MKKYNQYMDGVTVSDTLHEKLKKLEQPKKAPAWRKYGALAAALVLVIGLGAWGLSGMGSTELGSQPAIAPAPSQPAIEIGPARPEPLPNSPGMETMGGYEVNYGETVAYYFLPRIQYGQESELSAADYAPPVGVMSRDLTEEELLALLGGETNLTAHLDWDSYDVGAYAMVNRDGSLWLLCVYGSRGDTGLEHFLLEVAPGQLPEDCAFYPNSEVNNIWERDVWAASCDTDIGSARQVSFVDGEFHYRFEITGKNTDEIEELTSRLVRFIVAGDGLTFEKREEAPNLNNGEMNTPSYDPNVQPAPTVTPTPTP